MLKSGEDRDEETQCITITQVADLLKTGGLTARFKDRQLRKGSIELSIKDVWITNFGRDLRHEEKDAAPLYNCKSLIFVDLSFCSRLIALGDSSFHGSSCLRRVELPISLTSVGHHAFSRCSSLKSINLPSRITSINHDAFDRCSALTCIEFPRSMTKICENTLLDCTSLITVTLPASLKSVDDHSFKGCKKLESVILSSDNVSFGDRAFQECNAMIKRANAAGFESEWGMFGVFYSYGEY